MKLHGETAEALKIRAPYEDFNGGDDVMFRTEEEAKQFIDEVTEE